MIRPFDLTLSPDGETTIIDSNNYLPIYENVWLPEVIGNISGNCSFNNMVKNLPLISKNWHHAIIEKCKAISSSLQISSSSPEKILNFMEELVWKLEELTKNRPGVSPLPSFIQKEISKRLKSIGKKPDYYEIKKDIKPLPAKEHNPIGERDLHELKQINSEISRCDVNHLCETVGFLQEVMKARDLLIFFEAVVKELEKEEADIPCLDQIESIETLLNKASEVREWCQKNEETLLKVESLNFHYSLGSPGAIKVIKKLEYDLLTSLPEEIGLFKNLKHLNLEHNLLTSLPKEIGQLTNLQKLRLNNNLLIALPNEIGQLTNLQTLSLNNNLLTSLPNEIGQLANLQALWLCNNLLSCLPKEIGNLAKLESLYIEDNEFIFLPAEIGNLMELTDLWLYNNPLISLPTEMVKLEKLEEINIGRNDLLFLCSQSGNLKTMKKKNFCIDYNTFISLFPEIKDPEFIDHLVIEAKEFAETLTPSIKSEIFELGELIETYSKTERYLKVENVNLLLQVLIAKKTILLHLELQKWKEIELPSFGEIQSIEDLLILTKNFKEWCHKNKNWCQENHAIPVIAESHVKIMNTLSPSSTSHFEFLLEIESNDTEIEEDSTPTLWQQTAISFQHKFLRKDNSFL